MQTQGIESCKTEPGFHKPTEPEGSILASRLARRMEAENTNVTSLDLVGITNVRSRGRSAGSLDLPTGRCRLAAGCLRCPVCH